MVVTELFAQTYKSDGLATVRYPVLEISATIEPFDNGRGFTLRALRAGKPRNNCANQEYCNKAAAALQSGEAAMFRNQPLS